MKDVKTVFDQLETRCPRLGGTVTFDYCRKVGHQSLPCAKALICWEPSFPVGRYMAGILTEEEWRLAFESAPKGRLDQILEAAARAKSGGVE